MAKTSTCFFREVSNCLPDKYTVIRRCAQFTFAFQSSWARMCVCVMCPMHLRITWVSHMNDQAGLHESLTMSAQNYSDHFAALYVQVRDRKSYTE